MNLADGLSQAYTTKWSFVNSFNVHLFIQDTLLEAAQWEDFDVDLLQLSIISIDTAQLTNGTIEQFVADKWVIHNGRDEVYRFTIVFRDKNQMELYTKFIKMYKATRLEYFDDVKISVSIQKDPDWGGEEINHVITFDDALIENISQVQFSNITENQIAEFSVGFKATKYYV